MDKFGRNYLLSVQRQDGSQLDIKPPFTIEFDITRTTFSSLNTCAVRIYNLSENNRNQIRKNINDYGNFKAFQLKAGYGDNIPVIFLGNVTQAWSVREGVNFITTIESFDGGFAFANGLVSTTFTSGTPQTVVYQNLISYLPGVQLGVVGSFPGSLSRGNSYVGSAGPLLVDLTNHNFFIDNGKANILNTNECLKGALELIDSADGLLGTPVLEETILTFDMIFEPRLVVGQKIALVSSTEKLFNGEYKVISVKHRGTISEAVCGEAITSVSLFTGTQFLSVVGPQL